MELAMCVWVLKNTQYGEMNPYPPSGTHITQPLNPRKGAVLATGHYAALLLKINDMPNQIIPHISATQPSTWTPDAPLNIANSAPALRVQPGS